MSEKRTEPPVSVRKPFSPFAEPPDCCCDGKTVSSIAPSETCCCNDGAHKPRPAASDPDSGCCCGSSPHPTTAELALPDDRSWRLRYGMGLAAAAVLWWTAYSLNEPLAHRLVFDVAGLAPSSPLGSALEFFIYDTVKILLLLVALIYVIAWVRAGIDTDRLRAALSGKKKLIGCVCGAAFGAVTPFCSCSSVPLFLGFASAGIPMSITMAFLITSPIINEIAVVLLWNLLGWKLALIYVSVGLTAGVLGGLVMEALNAERLLQPHVREAARGVRILQPLEVGKRRGPNLRQRHLFALYETGSIFKRVWLWVVLGVGIGAGLHGFVPDNWFAEHFGAGRWWTVPGAVAAGIPLYSNVTGIVPVMESLLLKGLPVGTTLAFCMSSAAASIPEMIMLHQVMTPRLQGLFLLWLWLVFTVTGLLLNSLQPLLF